MSGPPDPKPLGGRKRERDDVCVRGHDLAGSPVYNGSRHCRECAAIRRAAWKKRNADRLARDRRRYEKPRVVRCPDCGEEREIILARGASRRCRSCAGRKARTPRLCPVCETSFVPAYPSSPNRFCSLRCRDVQQARDRAEEGNPAYRTGRRVGVHIPGWRLKKKGESTCRNCGSRRLVQLHHVIPRGLWKDGRADLRNGIPLCIDCHSGWHSRKVTLYRDVLRPEEWEFVSTAELTGRETAAWLDTRYPARPSTMAA